MDIETFTLFFGDVELGQMTGEDSDFPNLFGHFYPALKGDPAALSRLQAYLDYSIAAARLGEEADYGPEWEQFMAEHDAQFIDLIETNDWYLRDQEGKRIGILIPYFCPRGEVVWRYNPQG